MSDTKLIEQIDRVLKDHYGEGFKWSRLFVTNFTSDGIGWLSIDIEKEDREEVHTWREFFDAKTAAKASKIV